MNILIDEEYDKDIYYKKITYDRVINITGEGGSGKSTLAKEYSKSDDYIVVDIDNLIYPQENTIEYKLCRMLIEKYGDSIFEVLKIKEDDSFENLSKISSNFSTIYSEIINYLHKFNKIIVLEGTQFRFLQDLTLLKGELICLRPSIKTCILQSIIRYKENNPNLTDDDLNKYISKRTKQLQILNPLLNIFLSNVDKISDVRIPKVKYDCSEIESVLNVKAIQYLRLIAEEYGSYMSQTQLNFLNSLLQKKNIVVDMDNRSYIESQQAEINSSNNSTFEKVEELRTLDIPLAHGGRVFNDNKIHFYISNLLEENPNISEAEIIEKMEEILIHELLHFFIRPKYMDVSNIPSLKKINSFTTEGLVDMCARDIQTKYQLFPKYQSDYGNNVIFIREMLNYITNFDERMSLIFNGTIDEIYNKTTTTENYSKLEFTKARDEQTDYDKLINAIAALVQIDFESCKRFLYNLSANYKNKEEALRKISVMAEMMFPQAHSLIKKEIDMYNGLKPVVEDVENID